MDNVQSGKNERTDAGLIRWSASESVEHSRGLWWYIIASLILVLVAGLAFWFKQWTTGGLAIIIFIALIVVGRKPARELQYELSDSGLSINGQIYPLSGFRAFGVRKDGALWQLVLIPIKRFSLSTTLFIPEDQGEKIVDFFGSRLPMEKVELDVVDKVSRRLRL